MDDTLVAQFTAITSTDPERAAQYLRLTDGNFEQAIQLYFDSPALDLTSSEAQPSAPSSAIRQPATGRGRDDFRSHPSRYTEDEDGIVHIDSDDGSGEFDVDSEDRASRALRQEQPLMPSQQAFGGATVTDDEAIARRLQEEFYGDPEAAAAGEHGVRAPMARTTETLVGPGADWGDDADELSAAVTEQMLARQRRQQNSKCTRTWCSV